MTEQQNDFDEAEGFEFTTDDIPGLGPITNEFTDLFSNPLLLTPVSLSAEEAEYFEVAAISMATQYGLERELVANFDESSAVFDKMITPDVGIDTEAIVTMLEHFFIAGRAYQSQLASEVNLTLSPGEVQNVIRALLRGRE